MYIVSNRSSEFELRFTIDKKKRSKNFEEITEKLNSFLS